MPRHVLASDQPASRFVDSFLLGDGRLGVTVAGGIGGERFDLNADTFWSGGPLAEPEGEGSSALLPLVREAVKSQDWARAHSLADDMQSDGWTQSFEPVGTVSWQYGPGDNPTQYRRELDLARAVMETTYVSGGQPRGLRAFVDPGESVLVAETSHPSQATLASFKSPHPLLVEREESHDDARIRVYAGRAPSNAHPSYIGDPSLVEYQNGDVADDGTVDAGMGFAVAIATQRVGNRERMLAAVSTGFRGWSERPLADAEALILDAQGRLSAALAESTDHLQARCQREHGKYFDRVDLDLTPSLGHSPDVHAVERFFDLGRYLLIAASRPGGQPANLQGLWNTDLRPAWSSNYTTNINTPMNYWAAETAALPELAQPLFEFIRELVDSGRITAQHHYGLPGSVVHHNSDLWRFSAAANVDPHWASWSSALPWLAAHLWDHIDFGGADSSFVNDYALPVHRAAVQFALGMLVEADDGALVLSPSTSPEHMFVNSDGSLTAVGAGSTLDQELAREVMLNYMSICEMSSTSADDDAALASQTRAALERLRLPQIRNGVLLEWSTDLVPEELGHRHLSHLYGVFPGARVSARSSGADFLAAEAAFRLRVDNGTGRSGWSRVWVLCLAARFRDSGLAERSLAMLAGDLSSDSMLNSDLQGEWPGGAVFQIDSNLGVVRGVLELLVQSHDSVLDLLPCLPASWPSGSVTGVRARGAREVDVHWTDGSLVSASIRTHRAGPISVELGGDAFDVRDGSGDAVTVEQSSTFSRATLSWTATAHETYLVTTR